MKRLSIIALVLILTASLTACGRRKNDHASEPTTTAPTGNTIIPDIDPTIETNIPDPSVDTSMPEYSYGTDATDHTDMYDPTEGTGNRARRVH